MSSFVDNTSSPFSENQASSSTSPTYDITALVITYDNMIDSLVSENETASAPKITPGSVSVSPSITVEISLDSITKSSLEI